MCDCLDPRVFGHVCHLEQAARDKYRREQEAVDEMARQLALGRAVIANWIRNEYSALESPILP